jgi:TolB-like protein/DNA-binding winged helix-turn-helix (wHTH) protein/Tfp pilus assembly protein PilF
VGATKISFDGWTLDPESGDLERAGTRIRLQEQPLQVLMELIDSRGRVVTREQLISKLWPKGVVDFDTGLNTAIRKLRVALGDTADTPRYIETLPRRGYRFIAALELDPAREPEPQAQPQPESAARMRTSDAEPVRTMEDSLRQATVPPRTGHRRYIAFLTALTLALVGVAVVRVWISREPAKESAATVTLSFSPPPHSVAVLPFVNISGDKDQEYFSDGLSEELIDLLTKVPELRVPARTSSFYFKGKQATIADIAKALAVAHVLEGSVRKSGNTLRITAQLVRVDNGYHVWSETYDRKPDDIFKIQDEIAGAVVTALKVHLLPMEQAAGQEERRSENLEAYNLYLEGRRGFNQGDVGGYQDAVTAFQAATALDPRYAAAYADLALAQFWLTDDSASGDVAADVAGFESALAAAQKAIALAPGLAAGYAARGFVRALYRFDFAGGQVDLDKAVALSPRDADVLHRSAVLLAILGKLPAAIAREEQALALDPLSAEICMRLGFFLVANQQLARARRFYEKALVIAPNSIRARFNLGELELLENRPEQALSEFRQTGQDGLSLTGQAKAEYSLGHVDASQRVLEQSIAKGKDSSPWFIARVYAWRGEKDQAFEWAERAYEQRDVGLTWLKIDSGARTLRDDPRFRALLRKMNLPE